MAFALPKQLNLDVILKLPVKQRVGVLAAINAVILGLIFYFLTLPQVTEISTLKEEIAKLDVQLENDRRIAANIPKYIQDKEDMERKLTEALTQLPNEKELPELIDSISISSERSGLKILIFKPGADVMRGFYAEVPVNMSVQGRFESLHDFSVKVGALKRIVNIANLDVMSEGHKNKVPGIRANFVATTFRFIPTPNAPPAPTGAGEKK
ncbi:MAG: type 4a pilus biogenesis protein PilO [Deltaproteobacteria bacterium]|nr:type 4a pilus biogenesis protein PilO [Deltaproteobacteria bacterium]